MKALLQAWHKHQNDPLELAIAGIFVLIGVLVITFGARALARAFKMLAERSGSTRAACVARMFESTRVWMLFPIALYAGASTLDLPPRLDLILSAAAAIGVALQVGLWASRLLDEVLALRTNGDDADGGTANALSLLTFAGRVVIWSLLLLLVLAHVGVNITALVAGLGIGGIAVALAMQNILGDLFASLSIVLDKPFSVGDFIVVDTLRGTVEKIGIKSTRVKSLDGESLVFANSELLKSRIRNFKPMAERRVLFSVGATYETPPEKVREIAPALRRIVEAKPNTRLDRAHFASFGDSALLFEVVYYMIVPDYNTFMDTQQAINLEIMDWFAAEGIGFAYPTRTLHIASMPPLAVSPPG